MQALNLLEGFDLSQLKHNSADYLEVLTLSPFLYLEIFFLKHNSADYLEVLTLSPFFIFRELF